MNTSKQALPKRLDIEALRVDPTSPSGLRWVTSGKGRRRDLVAGCKDKNGYYTVGSGSHPLWAHHVVFELTHGRPCRPGYEIDHKDRDPGNNHPDNLREVTKQQNTWNREGRNTAWLPKGLNMNKSTGRVQAIIGTADGKTRSIGSFMDHLDQSSEKLNALIAATLEAMKDLHGEHGCYDSFYCQLPIEAVMGPNEGWP